MFTTISNRFLSLSIIFCLIFLQISKCNFVDLQTSLGSIRGLRTRSSHNTPAIAFLGIPYAKAPVGERRFKKPAPHPTWAPQTLLATNYKSCCPQLDMNGSPHGSEDCLYLNIFVPLQSLEIQTQFTPNGRRLPVMVYIQGESFENGDAAVYGAEKLLDWDVILVTFNYRLGALGFLSTGDEHSPGNYGLYDQLSVLEWIQNHIGSFSGDSSKVTIFGQGAGAASAIFHLISPLSVGLFHAVIAQSGSPLCSWSLETEPEEAAAKFAHKVGCPSTSGFEMLRCLRRVSTRRLLTAQQQDKIFGEYPHRMLPTIETSINENRKLLPADPRTLLIEASRKIPLMMGYNRHETAFFYPLILNQFSGSPSVKAFLEQRLLPRFIRSTVLKKFSQSQTEAKSQIEKDVSANILFRYFNFLNSKNYTDLSTRFVNMSTDALYSSCIEETLQLYSSSTTQQSTSEMTVPFRNITYKYIYDHRGQNSMLNMILTGNNNHQNVVLTPNSISSPDSFAFTVQNSVCHGDELFNLFELKFASKKPIDNHDLRVERHMLSIWTDFAKHGFAPFGSGPEVPFWPSYSVNKPTAYIINRDIHIRFEPEETGSAHFWTRYIPSIIAQRTSASIQNNPKDDWSGREIETINLPSDKYTSVAKLQIFAWSMLSLSVVLILLVITLTVLLIYQRKKHTFQATENSQYRVRETSARALRRAAANAAAATSASNHSSMKRSRATTISTSQLY